MSDRTCELKASNQELEAFAYTLSQDLCTPLTVIKGFSGLLQLRYSAQLGDEGKDYLDHIEQSVERIKLQIEGMLALHHAKHVELKCELVDLSCMAQEIVATLQGITPFYCVQVAIADFPAT